MLPTGGGAARWLRATTTPKIEAKIEAEVEAEVEAGDEAVPPWRLPLHPCRQRMQQRRVLPQRLQRQGEGLGRGGRGDGRGVRRPPR